MARKHGDPADHYAVLGVESSATAGQITSAYRALVRVLHPDTRSGAPEPPERFGEVLSAYGVLRDPARRAAYDARRATGTPAEPDRPVPVRIRVRVAPSPSPCAPAIRPVVIGRMATARPFGRVLSAGPVRVEPFRPGTIDPSGLVLLRLRAVGPWR